MTNKGALAYLVEIAFVIAIFVQSLATNIKKFTKRKKGKRNPVVRVLTLYYCKWRCNNVLTLK
ncbi:MAG: hypothetical protein ACEY3B_01425, partial [Wolbachia sp.]